jgi:hypothetical protein
LKEDECVCEYDLYWFVFFLTYLVLFIINYIYLMIFITFIKQYSLFLSILKLTIVKFYFSFLTKYNIDKTP